MRWYLPSRAFPLLEMYEATWQHSIFLSGFKLAWKSAMFYQNFSDLITKKISDRRPESILLVSETSLFKTFYRSRKHPKTCDILFSFLVKCGEGPHFWWTGRENFFKHSSVANVSNGFMVTTMRRDCPASSGFSRLDATLWMERNRWERPFAFPSSMRVHVTPKSKRQITSLPLDSQET